MKDLKIYYVFHSCFVVEMEEYLLIFDYYKAPVEKIDDDFSLLNLITNSPKKILVFSSHGHYDHFNDDIFKWKNNYGEITYILSSDIVLSQKIKNSYKISEGEILKLYNIDVKAYGSSDLGVSFLIELDKLKIFHAGDLNWWYWKDDTEEEMIYMRDLYQGVVEKIKINSEIDIAFFPTDSRLMEFCYLGGEYFAEYVRPKFMIPMHFDEAFYVGKELKKRIEKFGVGVVEISKTNSLLKLS